MHQDAPSLRTPAPKNAPRCTSFKKSVVLSMVSSNLSLAIEIDDRKNKMKRILNTFLNIINQFNKFIVNKKVNIEANVEINIALIMFSGLTLYAEHMTIEVAPQGPTLTNKAPAKFIGFDKLKNV